MEIAELLTQLAICSHCISTFCHRGLNLTAPAPDHCLLKPFTYSSSDQILLYRFMYMYVFIRDYLHVHVNTGKHRQESGHHLL